MYVPPRHAVHDPAALPDLVDAHPLGAWVCQPGTGLVANHLPFLLDRSRGPRGTLLGHVARANPVWRQLGAGVPSVVMFTGPLAYITPGWYPGKAAHGRVVPTWNYVAVHVRGRVTWLHGAEAKRRIVRALTDRFEAGEAKPWSIDDAPADYIEAMLGGIVGLSLSIESVEAQFKLSQNRTEDDRSGVELGLAAREDSGSRAIARLMRRHVPFEG